MSPVLKYRDPNTGEFKVLSVTTGGGGGTEPVPPGSVVAGAGLTGGGTVTGNPVLNVGAGAQITVAADTVGLAATSLLITDWNAAVTNGWYRASNGLNQPDKGGWWYGLVLQHSTAWVTQMLWPFSINGIASGAAVIRYRINGTWTGWNMPSGYRYSYDTLDGFVWHKHGGNSGSATDFGGITRFATGLIKDNASTGPTVNDKWRLQCYDLAGDYTLTAIQVTEAGVITYPKTASLAKEAIAARETVALTEDVAATLGVVVDIVQAALTAAGLTVDVRSLIPLAPAAEPELPDEAKPTPSPHEEEPPT